MIWLSHTQSLRTPYIPQVTDELYYVPRAHEKYCEDIERRLDYRLRINEKVPKEIRRRQLMDEVLHCRVNSIEVVQIKMAKFKDIRCMVLDLTVLGRVLMIFF